MYKVGDVVMYYGNKYKVCDIRDSENLEDLENSKELE